MVMKLIIQITMNGNDLYDQSRQIKGVSKLLKVQWRLF